MNNCKICDSNLSKIFSGVLLRKYEIDYFQCNKCGFIQTEEPYWLSESYSTAIATTDIGLVNRNIRNKNITVWLIKTYFDYKRHFLDYAGGYGLFVRLMRDNGLDFFRQDIYCENLFAKSFDISDQDEIVKFELLTAFEVFEHLISPIEEINKMFEYSDSIFFSTDLIPRHGVKSIDDWMYFAKETGQHISFYTIKTLECIAKEMNCYLYSNECNMHILTKKKLPSNPFDEWEKYNKKSLVVRCLYKVIRVIEKNVNYKARGVHLKSLAEKDYEFLTSKIGEL